MQLESYLVNLKSNSEIKMPNLSISQVVMDAQRLASRVKDLDTLGSTLLIEAEGNYRLVQSLRQLQDDLDSLNAVSNNKTNAEMISRIQQHNANSYEVVKENRELKVCIEDYERALELIMQKYREHTNNKVLDSKINFKEVYNEKLWKIIKEQRDKITEMANVMQRAASMDDDSLNEQTQIVSRLQLENKSLRELLQISKHFGSINMPINERDLQTADKSVQTNGKHTAEKSTAEEIKVDAKESSAAADVTNNSSAVPPSNIDNNNK